MLASNTARGNASRRPLRATSRKSTGRTKRLTTATAPMAATSLCQDFGHDRQRHAARQDRNEQQQPDDAEILKEHHADDKTAVRRVELIQRAQFLEHDRGARERDEEPREEPDAPHRGLSGKGQHEQQDGSRGRANLKTAADQHFSPDPTDFGQ